MQPLLLPCPPHGPVLWADPAGVRNSDANVGWGDTQLHHRDTGAALRAHRSDTERTRDRSTTTPCSCSRPPGSRCFLQQPPKCTNRASGDDRSLWKAASGTACRSVSRLPRVVSDGKAACSYHSYTIVDSNVGRPLRHAALEKNIKKTTYERTQRLKDIG